MNKTSKKKGFIMTGLISVFLYLGFVLILGLIFIAFNSIEDRNERKITGHVTDIDVNFQIQGTLRTPVSYKLNGVDINEDFASLLTRYYLSQGTEQQSELQSIIKQESKKIFDTKYPDLKYQILISNKAMKKTDSSIAVAVAGSQTTKNFDDRPTLLSGMATICTYIPNPDITDSPIKIEFDFYNLNSGGFEREKYQALKTNQFNC